MKLCQPATRRMLQLAALVLDVFFRASSLHAQPAPGSITTHTLPASGTSIIDPAGNVYVMGTSGPVTPGAAQTQPGGGTCIKIINQFVVHPSITTFGPCPDVYLGKVDPTGKLVFGTLLGGQTNDTGTAIAVDSAGSIYVAGSTQGSFPTTSNAAIPTATYSGTPLSFLAKLSPDGSRFVYSTYLPNLFSVSGITVDSQGNTYVVGTVTGSAYAMKVSADGSEIVYSVILGLGSANSVAVDATGNAILVGQTNSTSFPVTKGSVQTQLAGGRDAFVTKLGVSGAILFSTLLGGSGNDVANVVQIDSADNIYVAGTTASFDFPTTAGSFAPVASVPMWNMTPGGFIAKLSPNGSTLMYSSYVMTVDNSLQPGVTGLTLGTSGDVYITGLTGAGFPVTQSAPQPCYAADTFLAHLDSLGALRDATYVNLPEPNGIGLANDGSIFVSGPGGSAPTLAQIRFGDPGSVAPVCLSRFVLNAATLSSGLVSPGEFITLTGSGIGPATGVAYQPDAQGNAPTSLAGVRVLFDGIPAPVTYVQSRQVNALAPFELGGKESTAITLEYNGATFGPVTANVELGNPGIFRLNPGVSTQAAALNQDGTVNGPANPASAGSVVTIWGTGFGPTDPACATGGLNSPSPVNLAPGLTVQLPYVNVNLGGYFFTPIQYAGGAPDLLCGVTQINLQVPNGLPSGPFQITPETVFSSPSNNYTMNAFVAATIYVK